MHGLRALGIAVALVISAALGIFGAHWYFDHTGQVSKAASALDPNGPDGSRPAAITTDAIVANLQGYLRTYDRDSLAFANLGIAYLQKARETLDPAYYPKADAALQRSLQINSQEFRGLMGMGALALAKHQFHDALSWGRRAEALNPYQAAVYGIIGDAQIELGDYTEAFATFQHMVDLRPDLTSYARISYARELRGDRDSAIEAMQAAVAAGAEGTEGTNWARVQLGNLYFDQGDFARAGDLYQQVLNTTPTYPYAQAGRANVLAAAGDYAAAIPIYQHLIDTYPLPQFVIALSDIYAAAGRVDDAARERDLVDVEQRLYRANGVDIDAEMALFAADHGRNLPAAVAQARASYDRRPSITVADVLAWTLYQTGNYAEAQHFMNEALRLGTRNALMYYHAGMIAYRLGDRATAAADLAQATGLNPRFSLIFADPAARLLADLKSGSAQTVLPPHSTATERH